MSISSHGGKGFADGEIERACILFIFGGKPFAKLCHLPQRGIGRAEDCEGGQLRFFPFYGNGLLCGPDTIRKPNPGKLIGFDAVGINAVHACGKSILKDAVAIDGMGIDLEPLCLQLGDISFFARSICRVTVSMPFAAQKFAISP